MKFKYKDQIVTASSKSEAIRQITEDVFNRAEKGDLSILKLTNDVLSIKNKDGNTIIHLLAIYFSINAGKEIVKLPKELLLIKNKYGNNPIHLLAMNSSKEILKLPKELLSIKNKKGQTPVEILNKRLSINGARPYYAT